MKKRLLAPAINTTCCHRRHTGGQASETKLPVTLARTLDLPVVGEDAFVDDNDEKRADSVKSRGHQLQEERGAVSWRGSVGCGRRSSGRRLSVSELLPTFMKRCHRLRNEHDGVLTEACESLRTCVRQSLSQWWNFVCERERKWTEANHLDSTSFTQPTLNIKCSTVFLKLHLATLYLAFKVA